MEYATLDYYIQNRNTGGDIIIDPRYQNSTGNLYVSSDVLPMIANTFNIGASPDKFKDAYFSGTVHAGSTLELSDSGIIDTNSDLVLRSDAGVVDIQDTLQVDGLTVDGGAIFNLGATDRIVVDAETITHTDAQGVIDIDMKTDSSWTSAIDVKLKTDTGLAAATYPFGYKAHFVPNAADSNSSARIAYYADIASDEAVASDDFHGSFIGYMFAADNQFNNEMKGQSQATAFNALIDGSNNGTIEAYTADLSHTATGSARAFTAHS